MTLTIPTAAMAQICAEARLALVGDPSASQPSDLILQRLVQDKCRGSILTYPQISNGAGWTLLTGDDLSAFYVAIGNLVAARYIRTPAGARLAGGTVETTVGPVKRVRKQAPLQDALAGFQRDAVGAFRQISLIGNSITGDTFAVSRSNGGTHAETVFDQAFSRRGRGDDGLGGGGQFGYGDYDGDDSP